MIVYFICRLDKNLLVKVADFGLSRDIYVQDYYKAQNEVPLPVKWLAPEALFDREFNTKTDVVSSSYMYRDDFILKPKCIANVLTNYSYTYYIASCYLASYIYQ